MYPLAAAVHAFEPDGRAVPHLRRLVEHLPQMTVHATAVSDFDGVAVVEAGSSSEISALGSETSVGIRVPTITIDSLLPPLDGPVGAMKIDTEGHDARVLAGAARTIEQDRPLLLCETTVNAPLISWAAERRYRVGAPALLAGEHLAFQWFEHPSSLPTKMVFMVPEDRAADLAAAANELYGQGFSYRLYRPCLQAFRAATRYAATRRCA